MQHNEETYFKQKDKYAKRAEKFLMMGGAAVALTMGALVAAPVLGALAVPTLIATNGVGYLSLAGFTANKIAEKTTDVYEPQSKREKLFSAIKSIREKAFGSKDTIKHKFEA